jgi:hypothetical protein
MASSSGTPKAKTPAPAFSSPSAHETDEEREFREFQEWKRFKELKNKSGSTPTSSHKPSSSKAPTPRPGGPSPSAAPPSKKFAGPPAKSGVLDMKEKERIVGMIGDLDEKHQSKIYEIIEKHQPTLLSGSTECDIEVRRAARVLLCALHACCVLFVCRAARANACSRSSLSITPLSWSSVTCASASNDATDS